MLIKSSAYLNHHVALHGLGQSSSLTVLLLSWLSPYYLLLHRKMHGAEDHPFVKAGKRIWHN